MSEKEREALTRLGSYATKYISCEGISDEDILVAFEYITRIKSELKDQKKINEEHLKLNGQLRQEINMWKDNTEKYQNEANTFRNLYLRELKKAKASNDEYKQKKLS